MIKHFCDRCEKELPVVKIATMCMARPLETYSDDDQNIDAEVFELCEECSKEVIKFATTKPAKLEIAVDPETIKPFFDVIKTEANRKRRSFGDWFDDSVKLANIPAGLQQRLHNILIRNCLSDNQNETAIEYLSKCTDEDIKNFKNCGKVMAPFVKKMRDYARKEIYGLLSRPDHSIWE